MKSNNFCGRIIIDGDACPRGAMSISYELSQEFRWEMIVVASFRHDLNGDYHRIMVDDEPQASDMAIINNCQAGDIIITQDWGLAAIVMAKKAWALSPKGTIYKRERMDFLLEERDIKAKARRLGGKIKGPSPRNKEDDERFRRSLLKLMCEG